jgi:hypothetical protein
MGSSAECAGRRPGEPGERTDVVPARPRTLPVRHLPGPAPRGGGPSRAHLGDVRPPAAGPARTGSDVRPTSPTRRARSGSPAGRAHPGELTGPRRRPLDDPPQHPAGPHPTPAPGERPADGVPAAPHRIDRRTG